MTSRRAWRYRVVDVFTTEPLEGNALAVFPDSTGISSEAMQKIARELNLSETVFVLPATRTECVAKFRIFTPGKEMDFAGHPTVGTAFILLDEGMVPKDRLRFLVEENVGPIPIRVDPGSAPRVWLTTPAIREEERVDAATAAALLGLHGEDLLKLPAQILNAGNPTLFVAVNGRETVDRISFQIAEWNRFKLQHAQPMCVFAFAAVKEGAYSRMFAPDYGIAEDPATGSSTGPLAAYMMKHGLVGCEAGTTFYSEQGTKMKRRSILHVRLRGNSGVDGIEVGGDVTPLVEATMTL